MTGGSGLVHDCGTARSIGYYLEVLVCLGLFGRKARHVQPVPPCPLASQALA